MAIRRRKTLGAVGSLALSSAIFSATVTPLHGYSLSIYRDAPLTFWIGVIVALGTGLLLLSAASGGAEWVGAILSAGSIFAIACLPLWRRYYFFGAADPMSHLGITKDVLSGNTEGIDLFYPVTHTLSAEIALLLGVPTEQALLITMVTIIAVWFMTVPVLIRRFGVGHDFLILAVVPALFMLPINPISIYPRVHPATLATFLTPFVLLTFTVGADWRGLTLASLGSLVLLFMHPMAAIALIPFLLLFFATNKLVDRNGVRNYHAISLTLAFGLLLYLWIQNSDPFKQIIVGTLLKVFMGVSGQATVSRASSFSAIGGNIVVYLSKIGAKYVLLGAVCSLAVLKGFKNRNSDRIALTLSSIPIAAVLLAFIASGEIGIWSRYFAVLMVIGTILTALGFADIVAWCASAFSPSAARRVVVAISILALCVTVPTIHPDPYTLQPNEQITDQSYESFETIFGYSDADTTILGIRATAFRFSHAIYGVADSPNIPLSDDESEFSSVPDHFDNRSLHSKFDSPHLVVVTDRDVKREVDLYNGLRFTNDDFRYLNRSQNVDTVYSSGTVRAYYTR